MVLLVVEDGSGVSNSNTYWALADVTAYHADRGNAYWAAIATDDLRSMCLIRATDYIDKRFARMFRGFRMQKDQALAWPRLAAFDNDGYAMDSVPTALKKAVAEYALRAAIYNVLAPDPMRVAPKQDMSATNPNSAYSDALIIGPARSKSTKVGPIEEKIDYDSTTQLAQLQKAGGDSRDLQSVLVSDIFVPMYPEADLLIEDLIENGASIKMTRA